MSGTIGALGSTPAQTLTTQAPIIATPDRLEHQRNALAHLYQRLQEGAAVEFTPAGVLTVTIFDGTVPPQELVAEMLNDWGLVFDQNERNTYQQHRATEINRRAAQAQPNLFTPQQQSLQGRTAEMPSTTSLEEEALQRSIAEQQQRLAQMRQFRPPSAFGQAQMPTTGYSRPHTPAPAPFTPYTPFGVQPRPSMQPGWPQQPQEPSLPQTPATAYYVGPQTTQATPLELQRERAEAQQSQLSSQVSSQAQSPRFGARGVERASNGKDAEIEELRRQLFQMTQQMAAAGFQKSPSVPRHPATPALQPQQQQMQPHPQPPMQPQPQWQLSAPAPQYQQQPIYVAQQQFQLPSPVPFVYTTGPTAPGATVPQPVPSAYAQALADPTIERTAASQVVGMHREEQMKMFRDMRRIQQAPVLTSAEKIKEWSKLFMNYAVLCGFAKDLYETPRLVILPSTVTEAQYAAGTDVRSGHPIILKRTFVDPLNIPAKQQEEAERELELARLGFGYAALQYATQRVALASSIVGMCRRPTSRWPGRI